MLAACLENAPYPDTEPTLIKKNACPAHTEQALKNNNPNHFSDQAGGWGLLDSAKVHNDRLLFFSLGRVFPSFFDLLLHLLGGLFRIRSLLGLFL